MARTLSPGANPDRQNRFIFWGAIGLAVLAAIFVFVSLSNFGGGGGGSSAGFAGDSVDVVVASRQIEPGTTITGADLEIATLPVNGIVEGALTDQASVEGLTVRYPLAPGEQLTAAKVGQGTDEDNLAGVVPPGLRAVAVEIDESSSVGGLIVAGDHVDVIGVFSSTDSGEGEIPARGIVLVQDVEVLSVAQTAQVPVARFDAEGNPIETDVAEGSISAPPDDTGANADAESITLAVAPEDAPLLALAQSEGGIVLSLRGPGDADLQEVGPAYLPEE